MSNVNYWSTLAVEDLDRARAFYTGIGFTVRNMPSCDVGITVHPDDSAMICLFTREAFAGMVAGQVCDANRSQEVVQSVYAPSREDVDAMAAKAEKAGGRLVGEPEEAPWGYGCGFTDPDGHVWSVVWMPPPPAG